VRSIDALLTIILKNIKLTNIDRQINAANHAATVRGAFGYTTMKPSIKLI
jgi:hypothetical protein